MSRSTSSTACTGGAARGVSALAVGACAALLLSTAALVGSATGVPWHTLVITLAISAAALVGSLGAAGASTLSAAGLLGATVSARLAAVTAFAARTAGA